MLMLMTMLLMLKLSSLLMLLLLLLFLIIVAFYFDVIKVAAVDVPVVLAADDMMVDAVVAVSVDRVEVSPSVTSLAMWRQGPLVDSTHAPAVD